MVTAFASAYMAEVIRGGLQAIPSGQYEAPWLKLFSIDAFSNTSPGASYIYAGSSIPLLVSLRTPLVIVIGLFDTLGIANAMVANPDWWDCQLKRKFLLLLFLCYLLFNVPCYQCG